MPLETLKKRTEFLRVRGGRRVATSCFVLEGKMRRPAAASNPHGASPDRIEGPRFGFTVTKKLGGAVIRNRIRRRLKAAIEAAAVPLADPDFDYVVLARHAALDQPFATLVADIKRAMKKIHSAPPQVRKKPIEPKA
jgi:ribonuclease P protein component